MLVLEDIDICTLGLIDLVKDKTFLVIIEDARLRKLAHKNT